MTATHESRAKVGFIGDVNGAAGSALSADLDLQSFSTDSLDSVTGVLVDGNSGQTSDGGSVQKILDSGKPLVITNANQAMLDMIDRIAGTKLNKSASIIVCAKDLERSIYTALELSGEVEAGAQEPAAAAAVQASNAGTARVDFGRAIAAAFSRPVAAPKLAAAFDDSPGLIPPVGATWGRSTVMPIYPLRWQWSWSDDVSAGDRLQSFNSPANIVFYVYYVDGDEGGTPPYYIVIMKKTGSFSAGSLLANNQNSVGFFQYAANIDATVTNFSNQPFGPAVTFIKHSPNTFSNNSVPVELQVEMPLVVRKNTHRFTATEQTATSIPQWALEDMSTASGPAWYFHQVDTWDPSRNPPWDFGDIWWQTVYTDDKDHSHVFAMPTQSISTFSYTTVAAWRFDGSLIPNPKKSRSLLVKFSGNWWQKVAFLHSPDGCQTGHHHLHYGAGHWWWSWYMDLGRVAVPTR
ncbi:MAG TPA: hypothetical protein VFV34_04340 [Blastocatellia bacterium]|nr:hypothetical protein [Blastocatellia bacterium]